MTPEDSGWLATGSALQLIFTILILTSASKFVQVKRDVLEYNEKSRKLDQEMNALKPEVPPFS
jgi:hypothetical protein